MNAITAPVSDLPILASLAYEEERLFAPGIGLRAAAAPQVRSGHVAGP